MGNERGFVPQFAVEIEGETIGYINSIKGGDMSTELQKLNVSTDNLARKVVHGLKVSPYEFDIAMGVGRNMTNWIMATVEEKRPEYRSGHIIIADKSLKSRVVQEFRGALMSEIGFPALTGDGKQTAMLKVKIDPEEVYYSVGDGNPIQGILPSRAKDLSDKKWSFSIDGMPEGRCTKVDAFTIKQDVVTNPDDGDQDYFCEKLPGNVEISELSVEFACAADNIARWHDWAYQWLNQGNRGEGLNRTGRIEYKAPNGDPVATLALEEVGLIEFGFTEAKGGDKQAYKMKAKFFVEKIKLDMPNY